MAISANALTAGVSAATLSAYATAAVTPTANRLIIAVLEVGKNNTGSTSSIGVTGNGLTWTTVANIGIDGATSASYNAQLSIFRAVGAAPTNTAISFSTGFLCVSAAWSVFEIDGADITGSNGDTAIVQIVSNKADLASAVTVTTAAFTSPHNGTVFATGASQIGTTPAAFTIDAGYTSIHATGTTHSAVATGWRIDNDTSVTTTANETTNIGGVVIEIKVKPGGMAALLGAGG